jgi:uncharacterized SAM-binding protein YcdF (DUF218 family)
VNADDSWNVIIVPDGLASKDGITLRDPSFVYRAVLDAALARPAGDALVLAPANDFGGTLTEEAAAEQYLRARGRTGPILRPAPVGAGYVDTRGNALHLRRWLQAQGRWPLPRARLMVARRHARRALLCFRKEGFVLQGLDAITYAVPPQEGVPPRLWYYRWPSIHRLYEAAAYLRDWLRPSSTT